MFSVHVVHLAYSLFVILILGVLSGALCKRVGVSLIVGYLLVGVLVGEGGLRLLSQQADELEYLARAGALLLLFAVGIEFSLEELVQLSRFFFVGGATQMFLAALPVIVVLLFLSFSWQAAFLIGFAVSLSSTVLVFKGLSEWGHLASPAGRRAISILLFQDIALVPLVLLIPLLTGGNREQLSLLAAKTVGVLSTPWGPLVASSALYPGEITAGFYLSDLIWLVLQSAVFLLLVALVRYVVGRFLIPLMANLRSIELLILFSLTILVGLCLSAEMLDLPPAIGALAAGLVLSGNRLSRQIDSLVLPYRESFAAVFFVTLGALLKPQIFLQEPLLLAAGFLAIVLVKTLAATVALKFTGLPWKAALGAGFGLAQLGEFSFVLLLEGMHEHVLSPMDYNRILFIALGTLILTPQLIKWGFRWAEETPLERRQREEKAAASIPAINKALVVGIGPIGRRVASGLETLGIEVSLVDFSPINLYPFAQAGFRTIAGDALDAEILRRAGITECRLLAITVPDDATASQIAEAARQLNPTVHIIVRCRYLLNVSVAKKAGADRVISEEQLAAGEMLELCTRAIRKTS